MFCKKLKRASRRKQAVNTFFPSSVPGPFEPLTPANTLFNLFILFLCYNIPDCKGMQYGCWEPELSVRVFILFHVLILQSSKCWDRTGLPVIRRCKWKSNHVFWVSIFLFPVEERVWIAKSKNFLMWPAFHMILLKFTLIFTATPLYNQEPIKSLWVCYVCVVRSKVLRLPAGEIAVGKN